MRGMETKVVSSLENFHNLDFVSYLTQREASEIDEILMGPLGFSVDQLMVDEILSLSFIFFLIFFFLTFLFLF